MDLLFLGSGSVLPEAGREAMSLLVAGRHMIDTGWFGVEKLRLSGGDAGSLESIFLTHLHHDHYLGLPQILFHMAMRGRQDGLGPLRILGPAPYLADVIDRAWAFLQADRFPEIRAPVDARPLQPGESTKLGRLRLDTLAAIHTSGVGNPEPALCLRLTDPASSASFVFTGDTSPHPGLPAFARGASLLIHDAAHSSAIAAGEAGVSRLLLGHYPMGRGDRLLAEAREVFPKTDLATDGMRVDV
jgi:ribonuclease Z